MVSSTFIVLCSYFIVSFLSLGAILSAGLGNTWWVSKTSFETYGLWKDCFYNITQKCIVRSDILKFRVNPGTDPIIVCLLLSFIFMLFSTTMSLIITFCCEKKYSLQKSAMQVNAILLLISVICSVDGMVYSEYQLRHLLIVNDRGWSFFAAWAGTILQVSAFLLMLFKLCFHLRMNVRVSNRGTIF
ncbi:uncharacterized protein LOC105845921 [Hydra vulgaris]|uniref:uncharacterized protein LOC105845921 n=1 Tax=Hydra vulgaris TaxID=6087 RepID=UPI00064122A8|nr:uncharacterized protein LOC105845921 [Hydra vulgaris]